jgi:hypothetical protein
MFFQVRLGRKESLSLHIQKAFVTKGGKVLFSWAYLVDARPMSNGNQLMDYLGPMIHRAARSI